MPKTASNRPRPQDKLYALSGRIYSGKRCFYCGQVLRGNKTREHVFPQWLKRRFGLANQHLTLLNGSLIPYRQLTVPCCSTCHNVHLSKLEKRHVAGNVPSASLFVTDASEADMDRRRGRMALPLTCENTGQNRRAGVHDVPQTFTWLRGQCVLCEAPSIFVDGPLVVRLSGNRRTGADSQRTGLLSSRTISAHDAEARYDCHLCQE
jgi:hypothetical protein